MTASKRRVPSGVARVVYAGVCVWVALLLLVPLVALVVEVGGGLDAAQEALRSKEARSALGLSVAVALACVVANGIFGVAGALVLVRQRFLGRRVLDALVDLPLGDSEEQAAATLGASE